MLIMRDFRCSKCDSIMEELVDSDISEIECRCGGVATKELSTPTIQLEGISGAFPGAADHWAKIREDRKIKLEKKKERNI